MEVVRSNFNKVIPLLEDALKRSVFVAIDTEFTGLSVVSADEPSLFDSMNDRYCKLKRTVKEFMVCQFGLSAFVKDSEENRYVAHSFNFYLFPKEQGKFNPRFGMQASNMEFLCEHKFDFNKWIYEGIPYCNKEQEALVMDGLEDHINKRTEKYIEDVGFRHIFQLLVKSKKPLMGHNMLLDLAFMIEKFHAPLPARYEEFKKIVHQLFPNIIDTKNLCFALKKKLDQANLLERSSLDELYGALMSREGTYCALCMPNVTHADYSIRYGNESCFHEAGYDAFCVGFVFLRLAHLLAMKGVSSTDARPVHIKQYLRLVQPYSNRVNLSRGPVNFIDFKGPDPRIRERGLLMVSSTNAEPLDEQLLQRHMDEFGRIDIQFLRPDCAVVAVATTSIVPRVLESMSLNPIFEVKRYRDTSAMQYVLWSLKTIVLPAASSILILVSLYQIWKFYS